MKRFVSVDILRGITVAAMILVNNPGSWSYVHPYLEHAHWHGLKPADFVFPFFLFIVGLSIVFSLKKSKDQNLVNASLIYKIVKRGLILFGIGLVLNAIPDFDFAHLRIPGVLQRIGLVFIFAAIAYVYLSTLQRLVVVFVILTGYWVLMTMIPIPGTNVISLEMGHNLAAWVDFKLLPHHLWQYTQTWDPEGFLSTIPAIATCLIGSIMAEVMLTKAMPAKHMTMLGIGMLVIGVIWSTSFPYNKALWTSSFVLATAGVGSLILAAFIYLFEDLQISKGVTVWKAFGANPLAAYVGSEFVARLLYTFTWNGVTWSEIIFQTFSQVLNPMLASVAIAVSTVAFWALVCYLLYRKNIIIKI
jgi:predicted acyltransferase